MDQSQTDVVFEMQKFLNELTRSCVSVYCCILLDRDVSLTIELYISFLRATFVPNIGDAMRSSQCGFHSLVGLVH